MAVLGFPSCDSGSYTTPDVKGQLDKRRESFSQRFTKNQEEPRIRLFQHILHASRLFGDGELLKRWNAVKTQKMLHRKWVA